MSNLPKQTEIAIYKSEYVENRITILTEILQKKYLKYFQYG